MKHEKEDFPGQSEQIRNEFQVERMILFTDAVFAIVITLMAIELRLPGTKGIVSEEAIADQLIKLVPVVTAYIITFSFVGIMWFQHLQLFSLLKDYDRGLVIRNMIMLFFIGLFPFSVTMIAEGHNSMLIPVTIYFCIVIMCKGAQIILAHYILVGHPELRTNANIEQHIVRFKKSKVDAITIIAVYIIICISFSQQSNHPGLSLWWCAIPIVLLLKYFRGKIK
jgi:uncharacterized membrane protein